MDQIILSDLPATIGTEFPLVTGILWKNVATPRDVMLRLRAPSGDLREFSTPALLSQYDTQLQVTHLRGLTLRESGCHTFEVIVDGELCGTLEFDIVVMPRFTETLI